MSPAAARHKQCPRELLKQLLTISTREFLSGAAMKSIHRAIASLTLLFAVIANAPAPVLAETGPIPAAPWMHEGMVFTSSWIAIHVPGNGKVYRENPDGTWQDDVGNTLSESDLHGTSASGVSQTLITCIEGDKMVTATQGYANVQALGLTDPMPLQNASGFVSPAGQDNENWIDPAHLAAIKTDNAIGRLVQPTQWRGPSGMRDAIRIDRINSDGFTDHVYDKKTGICVHYAISTKAAPTPQPLPVGEENQGDTLLTQGDFLAARDIKVPWSHEDPPAWIDQFKALHFRGQIAIRNSALPMVPNQLTLDLLPMDHGNGWIRVIATLNVRYQNAPAGPPGSSQTAFGRTEFGGLWAGPKALATLKQGDLLDEDPITKMRTTVTQVSDQSVTISQSNNSGEIVSQYDKQSGMLIGSSYYQAVSKQDWSFRLQGRE